MDIHSGLLLLLLGIVACHAAEEFDTCRDGAGVNGICTTLTNCQPIRSLFFRGNLSYYELLYLRNSVCGTHTEKRLLVCCPLSHKLKTQLSAPSSLPSVSDCGFYVSTRIATVSIAERGHYPWLARILYNKSNKRFGFHCGGVLINERYVLSAAHCIKSVPSSWTVYKVRFGEYDTTKDRDCDYSSPEDCSYTVSDVLVASYYVHEDYFQEKGVDYNDIALIRLVEPVQFTPFIKPICLPTTEEKTKLAIPGHKMTVAGWGQTENRIASRYLKHLKLNIWSNEKCAEAFNHVNVDIVDTQLCAGDEKYKGSYHGDSGGPLMKAEMISGKSVWFLKGIASFGTESVPVVYTRVSKFMDWIQDNIGE